MNVGPTPQMNPELVRREQTDYPDVAKPTLLRPVETGMRRLRHVDTGQHEEYGARDEIPVLAKMQRQDRLEVHVVRPALAVDARPVRPVEPHHRCGFTAR